LGEACVLVQRREPVLPDDLAVEAGRRVFTEQADVIDLAALREIGTRYAITGIVHLAGSVTWPPCLDQPISGARSAISGLLNVLQVARDWEVLQVGIASTIGVYGGTEAHIPLHEDTPLWGLRGNPHSPFTAAPQLVHAAARRIAPDFSALRSPAYADDGLDLCYVKDCARAIALLHLAPRLNHRTYNIASGTVLTNRDVAAALSRLVPDLQIRLPDSVRPAGPGSRICLDTSRLREDTGYRPAYDTDRAVADYLAWLRAGHQR
jgi:UDP-glucose 4-epimerase